MHGKLQNVPMERQYLNSGENKLRNFAQGDSDNCTLVKFTFIERHKI